MPALVAESRLPVGSSARMMAGRPASALAMATRWHSPPDSSAGRWPARPDRPTSASASAAAARRCPRRNPAVQQPGGHVVQRGQRRDQEELLEHEPDPVRPDAGQRLVGQPVDGKPGHPDAARGRAFQGAGDGQHGRLARSGRSDDRGELTRPDRHGHRPERGHRRRSGMLLGHPDQLQSTRSTVHCATTTLVPAAMPAPLTWTCPEANRPAVTPTSR